MNNFKILKFLFLLLCILQVSLFASDSFEFKLTITEKDIKKNILYKIDRKSLQLKQNNLNKKIKYEKIIIKSLNLIHDLEKSYQDKEIYQIYTLKDSGENVWTFTIRVTSKDTSVSHFISLQNEINIEGWINRDNKDIFGLRILNF